MTEALYFENGEKKIFGVMHHPTTTEKKTGIILCYPLGMEYTTCHRAYTVLSSFLSHLGYHTLRFDYTGTGDSYGNIENVDFDDWLNDLNIIIQELKESTEIKKFILIGLRIGASLIGKYSITNKIDGLILWNPVWDGNSYIKELKKEYKAWRRGSFASPKNTNKTEYIGFLMKKEFEDKIKRIKFNEYLQSLVYSKILVLDDDDSILRTNNIKLSKDLDINFNVTINKKIWVKGKTENEKSVIPRQEIDLICNWITAFE